MEQSAGKFLEQLKNPAVIINDSGDIQFANAEFADLCGYDAEAVYGSNISDFLSGESANPIKDILESEGHVSRRSVSINNGSREVEVSIHPLDADTAGQYFGIIHGDAEPKREETIEKWRSVMEQLTDITPLIDISCLLTPDHEFLSINEEATETYGMTPAQFHGEICYELVHDQSQPIDACPCEEVLDTGEPTVGNEFQEDGRHYVAAAAPVYHDNGDIAAIAHTIQDITDRKTREAELKRQKQRAEQYFETAGNIMVVLDRDGTVADINERGSRLLGYGRSDLIGSNWFDYFVPEQIEDDVTEVLEGFWDEDAQPVKTNTNFLETKAGKQVFVKWHNTALRDQSGNVTGVLASGIDITERREKEQELRREKKRLDEFASVVSHDLRNPLQVAQGRTELAREECDSDHLDEVASGIERSLELIGDVLALAREGQEIGDREALDVDSLVETCWVTVETADAALVTDLDSVIHADRSRLRQLFENLIHNAVEHGGENVTVRVGSLPGGFYVEDDGPGVPPEKREEVFEPGTSGSDEGTGFGLAIVEQIVEAHGWEIRITDSSDGGARFEITGVEIAAE
jgi:PAS domain S-box-containing protein